MLRIDYFKMNWSLILCNLIADFFNGEHILYNPKHENHQNYFNTMNSILGIGKFVEDSFIAESMMFDSKIVREMLYQIESSTVKGVDWIEKIINACDFQQSPQAFSEFETYGNYCAKNYPELYKPRYLNTFREAGMICGRRITEKQLRKMSFDIDMASFEMLDMPCFPYNIPNLIYKYKILFQKIGNMSIEQIVNKIRIKLTNKKNEISDDIYRLPE